MNDAKKLSEEEWKKKLTPEQYQVLREKGTEDPFTGDYLETKEDGTYACAGCGTPLFSSDTKYDSGSGWPSFYDVISKGNIELHEDRSLDQVRTEIVCATCGGHLGHVFPDGPEILPSGKPATGQRYCINSAALNFKEK